MESIDDFAERFRRDVEKKCDCRVYKERLKNGSYHLRKAKDRNKDCKVFAYINQRKKLDRFLISIKEKWVKRAQADDLASETRETSEWGGRGYFWRVTEGDIEEYNKAVRAFAKICEVR